MGIDRYHRQQILPEIGAAGQQRLAGARILLVGCGALGTTLSDLLVRAGIGGLRVVDRDLVELTNLQRQVLFEEKDAAEGLPKAIAAARRLSKVNSSVQIDPVVADLNAGNIQSLAIMDGRYVDLILDGTDNVATRYLINDFAVQQQISWIYGACVGTAGRVMAIWPGKTACLRCIFPAPPSASELPACDTAGVLGPAAAAVASLEAAAAIRFLVEGAPTDLSRSPLISIDVWNFQMRSLSSARPQPDCPCCAQRDFPFLQADQNEVITTLCGRQTTQLQPPNGARNWDLSAAAVRLKQAGTVERSPWFVKCRLHEPAGVDLTLFPDGRVLMQGITDPLRAKSIYARFIGV